MKKSQKYNPHVLILLIVCGIFIALTLIVIEGGYRAKQDNNPPQANNNVFTSSINQFSVDLGKLNYQKINEDYNEVSIVRSEGTIQIGKIGTNFDTLNGYINDLMEKNDLLSEGREELFINGSPVIRTVIKFPVSKAKDQKTYFVYPIEWTVYTLSTDSEALYDDLDQIARSFRYIP